MINTDRTVFPEWAWKRQYWVWGSHDGITWSFLDARERPFILEGDTSYQYLMYTWWPITVENRESGDTVTIQKIERGVYKEE